MLCFAHVPLVRLGLPLIFLRGVELGFMSSCVCPCA